MGLTTLLRELEIVCGESVGEVRDDDPEWPWLVKGADLSDSVVSDPGVKCVAYASNRPESAQDLESGVHNWQKAGLVVANEEGLQVHVCPSENAVVARLDVPTETG